MNICYLPVTQVRAFQGMLSSLQYSWGWSEHILCHCQWTHSRCFFFQHKTHKDQTTIQPHIKVKHSRKQSTNDQVLYVWSEMRPSKQLLVISVKPHFMLACRPLGGSLVTWQWQHRYPLRSLWKIQDTFWDQCFFLLFRQSWSAGMIPCSGFHKKLVYCVT